MLSIVMPAYNEGEIIEATVREWHTVISLIPNAELIVVNDCSKDNTIQILNGLVAEFPSLRPVTPPQNGGHGKALRFGFKQARNEWIFQTDSDRQHIPEDFWKLWEVREQNDFIMGRRSTRADGWTRVAITTCMQLVNLALWGLWLRDANCPFKLMRRSKLEEFLPKVPDDSFIPMVMVSILCRKLKYRVAEVEVQHLPRLSGEQSLKGLWKWILVGYRCTKQLMKWRGSLIAS